MWWKGPLLILGSLLLRAALLAPAECGQQPSLPEPEAQGASRASPGDLSGVAARLARLRERLARIESASSVGNALARRVNLPLAKLHLEKALLYQVQGGFQTEEALSEAERMLDLLEAGKVAFEGAAGLQERAYLSPVDGSVQPYWIYVPRRSVPANGWPMLVFLHGYVPDTSKINPWLPGEDFWQLSEEKGFLVAVPYGRRNTDFEGIGEQDVLTVIEEAKRFFPVDPDRIFLGGPSMGGYGTYVIGLHFPHLFAGLVPMCGRSVPYVVETLYPDRLPAFQRIAVEPNTPIALAENAKHLPIFLQHGEWDYLISPQHSHRLVARWKELGYSIRYEEWKGHDHYIYWDIASHAAVYDWASGVRRNATPADVTYVTYTPKYGRAYWLTIEGIEKWGQPARVAARIESGNRVTIRASNITHLTLRLPASRVQIGKPLTLVLNGRCEVRHTWQPNSPVEIFFSKPRPGLRKMASLCGPVRETFLAPFLLVPGTQGDEATRQRLAAWAQRWATEWRAFADGDPPIQPDKQVTEAEIRQRNLVLFGDRRSNSILARIADRLPVELTSTGYRLGKRRVKAENLGLLMVYPNPLAPQRLVCVYSGLFWGDGLEVNHKFDLVPDFILFRNEQNAAEHRDTPKAVCAGYFDSQWQLSEDLTWQW